MPSLLLKTQSLPSRSRGLSTIGLAGSAPGEKLVAIYTCCRYGSDWAQWRLISNISLKDDNKATLDLGLDANLKITSVTGNSDDRYGTTYMLKCEMSDGGSWGPYGTIKVNDDESGRPSPSSPSMVLSHLSGDTTYNAFILRFHWRPQ